MIITIQKFLGWFALKYPWCYVVVCKGNIAQNSTSMEVIW
jgi:hypothetical protein